MRRRKLANVSVLLACFRRLQKGAIRNCSKAIAVKHDSDNAAPKLKPAMTGEARRTAPEKATRHSRSREATRERLIQAAMQMMAQKGVEGTAINDITEAADVGFGSFYNYFKSKPEIAQAVFDRYASALRNVTEAIGNSEQDVAVAVAFIQKVLLTKAVASPVWGWFVVHASTGLPEIGRTFLEPAIVHINAGIAQGRFATRSVPTAARIIQATMFSTMRGLLTGEIRKSAVNETVECLLRMLGMSEEEASELARRRLPPYIKRLIEVAISELPESLAPTK